MTKRATTEDAAASTAAMARWLGVFYAAGATLSLVSLALPHAPQTDVLPTALVAASAYPTAMVLLRRGRSFPVAVFHALLALGTVTVTFGVHFGHSGMASGTAAIFYVWTALYAFTFFEPRVAAWHVAVVAVAYGAVLWVDGWPGAPAGWVLVVGTVATTGVVVGHLAREIRELARRDPLTSLANRRTFEEQVAAELDRSRRNRHELCVVVVDLDHFKAVNDTGGHAAGDEVLRGAASAWSDVLRNVDCLARYGGDEFALLLPDCGCDRAEEVVERLRRATPDVRFSAGIACVTPDDDADTLISRADAALYDAKRAGRGRSRVDRSITAVRVTHEPPA